MNLSVVICTFNAGADLDRCLRSVLSQEAAEFDVLCLDGGSTDRTPDILAGFAARDPRVRTMANPSGLPEGRGRGKALGVAHTAGDIVCFLDQDNVLQHPRVFAQALAALAGGDPRTLGVLGGLAHNRRDPAVARYVALFGTDSFLAYRSVDFLRNWRRPPPAGALETMDLAEDNLPLTGGNCFFYPRRHLEAVGGYSQDVRVVRDLVRAGKNRLIILPAATKHYAARSLGRLARKKAHWGRVYFQRADERFDYWPRTRREALAFAANLAACLLLLPNFYPALVLWRRFRDPVALAFPFLAWLNTLAYAAGVPARAARRR